MDDTTVKKEDVAENELPEEVDETGKELDALKHVVSQLDNNYKRALADYQNLQRRTQEEKAAWIATAGANMVLKLLPVLDTLMLAEKHTQDKNFVLTVQQFLGALEDEGVTRIKTENEAFHPETMEAVSTKEGEKGKVLEEVRAGFLYHGNVLRPAQVIVGA